MSKIIKQNRKILYKCTSCGFLYDTKKWAEKCEAYCKKHHGCSLEIIKHAIK